MDYFRRMPSLPITMVETPTFRNKAERLLTHEERHELILHLATNPEAGAVMRGTGGVRKVRWARTGEGKSGGYRVVYFYHDGSVPLFMLTVYPKSEKANLTAGEREELRKLARFLVDHYKGMKP